MNYNLLLDITSELGYQLAMSGAETFRVEESVSRIFTAYGIDAEAFSIPNCLIVSVQTPEGKPITRMRRIGQHGTDLDAVERFSNLSRKICAQKPDESVAMSWLKDAINTNVRYRSVVQLLGATLGAVGFVFIFGGSYTDCLCSGLCGFMIGLCNLLMGRAKINVFFSTIAAAFVGSFASYSLSAVHLAQNNDAVTIAALMLLVPGLLFTNALRDIIYGDTNSGINRIVQVLLVAVAIALGTGAAWNLSTNVFHATIESIPMECSIPLQVIASIVACIGFALLFNIHGIGTLFCALGGGLTWGTFLITNQLTGNTIAAYFCASVVAAFYSEIMARVRKYPAISYLVVSVIPMLPGAGVYYTTRSIMIGDMEAFGSYGTETIAIAGAIAVGILIVSTLARLWSNHVQNRLKKV